MQCFKCENAKEKKKKDEIFEIQSCVTIFIYCDRILVILLTYVALLTILKCYIQYRVV